MVESKEVGLQARIQQQDIYNRLVFHQILFNPVQQVLSSFFIIWTFHQEPQGPLGEQVCSVAGQLTKSHPVSWLNLRRFWEGKHRLPVNKDSTEVIFTLCQGNVFAFLSFRIFFQVLPVYAGLQIGPFTLDFIFPYSWKGQKKFFSIKLHAINESGSELD